MRQLSAIANLEPVSRSFSENGSQMANLNKPVPQYFIRPTLFTDLIIQKRLRCEFAQFRVRWSLRERRIDKILERSNRSHLRLCEWQSMRNVCWLPLTRYFNLGTATATPAQ